jgi:hypothetical protein
MKFFKTIAVVAGLALGVSAHAATTETEMSDEAILLFNGDETPLDEQEALALADEESPDARHVVRRIRVRCQSFPFFTVTCRVPPRVISVRLVNQFGFAPCIAGRTFGATRNSVWVRGGCSGDFVVRYRPRHGGNNWN